MLAELIDSLYRKYGERLNRTQTEAAAKELGTNLRTLETFGLKQDYHGGYTPNAIIKAFEDSQTR